MCDSIVCSLTELRTAATHGCFINLSDQQNFMTYNANIEIQTKVVVYKETSFLHERSCPKGKQDQMKNLVFGILV